MTVLFITNIPSPYRVAFFNELGKKTTLTVLFEKDASDERNEEWKDYKFTTFRGVILQGIKVSGDKALCPSVCCVLKQKWDHIIVCDVSSPTGMLAIQYMKLHRIPYWIEGDGALAKSGKGFKERIKRHFISGAVGYFSTSKTHDDYYMTYGACHNRIYRYPFSSIHKADIVDKLLDDNEKFVLRNELGLLEEKIVVTVGRFSYQNGYGKGYDILIKSCMKLPKNYGIYIIGDEPTEEFSKWKEREKLAQVHFLGYKRKNDLFKYYRAADVFVLLSRGEAWGLVINEAMANGLPVITTDRCVAGLELVRNGENGYIVPVDDVPATVEAIKNVLSTDPAKMGARSLDMIRDFTIESMADTHVRILGGQ